MWIYILDEHGNPAPVGVPGEIYVGGGGVAIGYLNRPELNDMRFLPDAFRGEPRARMYRSGDLARYLPDGDVEYLGRIDDQVKVRGFRVEPGEIKSSLAAHPGVRDCIVVMRESAPQLCVYFIPAQKPSPTVSELRAFLRRSLPDYMIPAAWIELDEFPLTGNGKIDKRALPPPNGLRPALAHEYAEASSEAEAELVAIWRDVLGIQNVGLHDNFFDLGGHSLLLLLVQRRISARFNRMFSIAELFGHPTIRALAEALNRTEPPIAKRQLRGTTCEPFSASTSVQG
jgi:hypothetical protein